MKEFFKIAASKYDKSKEYYVVRPSSLNRPQDNSVMFVTPEYKNKWEAVLTVKDCIVIWPEIEEVPQELESRHVVILHHEPRLGFAEFFRDNNITYNN